MLSAIISGTKAFFVAVAALVTSVFIHPITTSAHQHVSYSVTPSVNVTYPTTTTQPTQTVQPNTNVTSSQPISNTTSNWSGYVASSGTYTSISGSWTVPDASGSGETSADATWIGIGGVTGDDLIQTGTQDVVTSDGQTSASAFFELLPDASQQISSVNVNPGDSMTASITEESDGVWNINIQDNTNGETFSQAVNYDSSESSAEWIEEDPSDGSSQIPLDDFGTVTFTGGSTTSNGNSQPISGSGAQSVTMVNSEDEPLATNSSLSSNGQSFSVTRTDVSSGSSISEFNNYPGSWRRQGSGIGREFGFNSLDF
jgi:hypothetical protein